MNEFIDSALSKLGGGAAAIAGTIGGVADKLSGTTVVNQDPAAVMEKHTAPRIMEALANNETGGVQTDPYSFRKPSGDPKQGDDIGKYQVTSGELKSWSKQFLGETITPDEFQKDPDLQDAYMRAKITELMKSGASTAEVIAMHRGGLTGYADPTIRQKKVGQRQDYVDKAMAFLTTLNDTKEEPKVAAN